MNTPITLRPFHAADTDDLVKHANNPAVAATLRETFPSPYTETVALGWIDISSDQSKGIHLAIDFNSECIGSIGATLFHDEHRYTAEIGYWLGQAYWSRGFATQALKIFTQQLFNERQLKRVYASVTHTNSASIKVLQKCGYVREAEFKTNQFIRGRFFNEYIYAAYPNAIEQ